MCEVNKEWAVLEIEQLRDDIEEADIARIAAEEHAFEQDTYAQEWQHKFKKYKAKLDGDQLEINRELRDKSMIYLSLINEYELLLSKQCPLKGAQFYTPEIQQLRKRGGLQV